MSIIQISKIQHRTGNIADLPQLDVGELGWATDERRLFIGNDPLITPAPPAPQPNNTEILTDVTPLAGGSNTEIQYNKEGDLAGNSKFTFNDVSGNVILGGNFLPQINSTYKLGDATFKWDDLFSAHLSIIADLSGESTNLAVFEASSVVTGGSDSSLNIIATSNNITLKTGSSDTFTVNTGDNNRFNIYSNGSGYFSNQVTFNSNIAVNGGNLSTTATSFNLINTNATSVNFAGAATTLEIGSASGNTNINNNLIVDGNTYIGGNLTVQGNFSYVNVETMIIEDPIIEIGGGANGAALTSNDNKDRGTVYHYYNGSVIDGFFGWDISNLEYALGSNVSVTNEVVTINTFGNLRLSTVKGSTAEFSGNISGANVNITGNLVGNVDAVFANIETIESVTGNILNINSDVGTFTGNVSAGNVNVVNAIYTNSLYTTTFDAGSVTVTGDLTLNVLNVLTNMSSPAGTITTLNSSTINASTGTFTGNVSVGNISILGSATVATDLITGNLTVTDDINANTYTGVSITITDDFAANNATLFTSLNAPSITFTNLDGVYGNFSGNISSSDNIFATNNIYGLRGIFTDRIDTADVIASNLISSTTGNIIFINSTDGNFSGSIDVVNNITGNIITANTWINTAGLSASGNIDGNNINILNDINTVDLNVSGFANVSFKLTAQDIDVTNNINSSSLVSNTIQANTIVERKSGYNWPVVTQQDIGLESNKIPLNQFLGSMAYQNASYVSIDKLTVTNLYTTTTTFDLLNTTATTINAFGAATSIEIGAATGTTNINNNLDVDGNINIDGSTLTTSVASFDLLDTTATTINAFGAATTIDIGSTTGNTTIYNNLIVPTGEIIISKTQQLTGNTGDVTANTVSGYVNFAAAATSLVVTNSLVSASSVIIATVATNDSTMTHVQVVASTGSFTIYAHAAPTAETRVNWIVTN